jgi:hypothetical protein
MPGPIFPIQNFVAAPYAGSTQAVNVNILSRGGVRTNDGQTIQPGIQSRVVNTQFDFLSAAYRGQAATINLQSQNNVNPLNQIVMIYVDNELNSQDVTVAFPDTQQYIGVPAFTTGYYPVLTGQLIATIYNGTSGQVPVTAQSQVSVIFCNFAMPGFLSLETLNVTFNSSSGPMVPVIGDKVQVGSLPSVSGNPITILPHMILPTQYVITGIQVNATDLFTDGVTSFGSTLPYYKMSIHLDEFSPGQSIRQFVIQQRPEFEGTKFFSICSETGLNIPVNGLQFGVLDLDAGGFAVLAPWVSLTACITYALVTL